MANIERIKYFEKAVHYEKMKDYENMINNCILSVHEGSVYAMVNLGFYYKTIKD